MLQLRPVCVQPNQRSGTNLAPSNGGFQAAKGGLTSDEKTELESFRAEKAKHDEEIKQQKMLDAIKAQLGHTTGNTYDDPPAHNTRRQSFERDQAPTQTQPQMQPPPPPPPATREMIQDCQAFVTNAMGEMQTDLEETIRETADESVRLAKHEVAKIDSNLGGKVNKLEANVAKFQKQFKEYRVDVLAAKREAEKMRGIAEYPPTHPHPSPPISSHPLQPTWGRPVRYGR